MLDARDVVMLLAGRGLLELSEVADGGLRIVEASRRNRNLHVLRRRTPSYVLKQGLGADRRATVAHEAAIHEYLRAVDSADLVQVLPRMVGFVPAECLLVQDFVQGAESLETYYARRARYSIGHARRLAEVLHTIHRATASEPARKLYDRRFPALVPWTLSGLHRPRADLVEGMSNGSMLAIRMIQGTTGFPDLLDAAEREWTPQCLIHGDLRFDNCLVSVGRSSGSRVTVVDWELARWGDPCWDVGTVLAGYLRSWLLSCPITGETPVEAVIGFGRHRLPDMQRAAGVFWAAYRDRMTTARDAPRVSLKRTMQFAAVQLVNSMFEELQASAELTGRAVSLAQFAFNVLERPEAAAEHFLALPGAA